MKQQNNEMFDFHQLLMKANNIKTKQISWSANRYTEEELKNYNGHAVFDLKKPDWCD